jgi:hypothetical protein
MIEMADQKEWDLLTSNRQNQLRKLWLNLGKVFREDKSLLIDQTAKAAIEGVMIGEIILNLSISNVDMI